MEAGAAVGAVVGEAMEAGAVVGAAAMEAGAAVGDGEFGICGCRRYGPGFTLASAARKRRSEVRTHGTGIPTSPSLSAPGGGEG